MQQLSPAELQQWLADPARAQPHLLDVREPWEFDICRLGGALSMPMRGIPARVAELDPDADTVVICHHGARSMQVAMFLERQGFTRVFNLSGGMDRWAREVDLQMPKY